MTEELTFRRKQMIIGIIINFKIKKNLYIHATISSLPAVLQAFSFSFHQQSCIGRRHQDLQDPVKEQKVGTISGRQVMMMTQEMKINSTESHKRIMISIPNTTLGLQDNIPYLYL